MNPPHLHMTSGRTWLAATVLFASLLFGQVGAGASALVGGAGGGDACCDRTCSCETVADTGGDARHGHEERSCSEEGADELCSPGCDDCACCPGAIAAIATTIASCSYPPLGDLALVARRGDPASGIPGRIFRPPDLSLL